MWPCRAGGRITRRPPTGATRCSTSSSSDRFSDGQEHDTAAARPEATAGRAAPGRRTARPGAGIAGPTPGRSAGRAARSRASQSKLDYLEALGVTDHLAQPGLQAARAPGHLPRLRHPALPRCRSALRHAARSRRPRRRGARDVASASSSTSSSTTPASTGSTRTAPAAPGFKPFPEHYRFGVVARTRDGEPVGTTVQRRGRRRLADRVAGRRSYTRAGSGDLGAGSLDDPHAEHKRTDFFTLRDLALDRPGVLDDLADCYKYWIALTDCDGFRIDTLKHVSFEEGRNFCGAIKEFAANLGKANFLLVGEVAGGDFAAGPLPRRARAQPGRRARHRRDAADAHDVAKGLRHPQAYFAGFDARATPRWVRIATSASATSRSSTTTITSSGQDPLLERGGLGPAGRGGRRHPAVHARHSLHLLRHRAVLAGPEESRARSCRDGRRAIRRPLPARGHVRAAASPALGPRGLAPGATGAIADAAWLRALRHGGRALLPRGLRDLSAHRCVGRCAGAIPVLRQGRQYPRPISNFGMPFAVAGPASSSPGLAFSTTKRHSWS